MGGQVHRTTIDRVAILDIDNPPVNALSQPTRRALADAVARADAESEIGAILITARGRLFSAGADISELGQKPREPHLMDVIDRIEAASKPVVVAWQGLALGGGLEIGLGAHRRIMARDAGLGLPEVRLGLMPSAGGTQRLPRLIGLPAALDLVASGRSIGAMEAFATGLCDEVTDGDLRQAGIAAARALIGRMQPRLSLRQAPPPDPGSWSTIVEKTRREARGRLAPLRAIELVGQTLTAPYAIGSAAERRTFLELSASDQSRALRHLFAAERAVRRVPGLEGATARPLGMRGVGGGGPRGAAIAATLIEHGLAVTLVERGDQALAAARERVAALLARAIRSGRIAETDRAAIAARASFSGDIAALARADLVIEAIVEEAPVKADLFARLETLLPPDAVIATNTSYLDIEAMADGLARPDRLIGLHFFSPAQVMRLVEIVRPRRASAAALATALDLVRRLDKIGVTCAAGRGFIGNRILGRFRAQCEAMLDEGVMPWEIDRALETFGLGIGPFAAQDMAGLDIAWARRRRLAGNEPAEAVPPLVGQLCERGHTGQKAGRGWYRYAGGRREPDPETEALVRAHAAALGRRRAPPAAETIQIRALAAMVDEGAAILAERVAARPLEIDLVMVHGYGFPGWRGGPMQEADARGLRAVLAASEENARMTGAGVAPLLARLAATGGSFAALNQDEAPEKTQPEKRMVGEVGLEPTKA